MEMIGYCIKLAAQRGSVTGSNVRAEKDGAKIDEENRPLEVSQAICQRSLTASALAVMSAGGSREVNVEQK